MLNRCEKRSIKKVLAKAEDLFSYDVFEPKIAVLALFVEW